MLAHVHPVMEDAHDIHPARCEPVHDEMTPDMEQPVLLWKLPRAMPQRWVVPQREERLIEQCRVPVVLLLAPCAERYTQNILVINLRLIRENERIARGGHRDSAGGRVLLCHGHSA